MEQKAVIIMGIIESVPIVNNSPTRLLPILIKLVQGLEKQMCVEAASPFREPMMKVLLRFPKETVDIFLSDEMIKVII